MKKAFFYGTIFASIFYIVGCTDVEYKVLEGFVQGTTYRIVYSDDAATVPVEEVVEDVFRRVDISMSGYNPESTLSKVNRNEDVVVEKIFENVFNRAREMYDISGGYFDVSAEPLFDMWGFGFSERSAVTDKMVDSVRQFIGMDKIRITDGKVVKDDPRMRLSFNAIAKGYTPDLIAAAFDSIGIRNYLIEVGGEIFCRGANKNGDMWNVGIDLPEEGNFVQGAELMGVLRLSGRGLATSGNYRKFYEEDGKIYSHTIDPLTGYPSRHSLLSVSVVADNTMTADAYATYLLIIGLEKAIEVVESAPELDAYLIYSEDGEYKIYKSAGIETRNIK